MTLIAFLGPSLSRGEARTLVKARFRPPARQGDVFRALEERPSAIALIDGVFESSPSVWHHELLAAQACGVRVYGAASMGALRAAELPGVVTPVGEIADRYLRGAWVDDGHVALLHGDEASGFRALTVPHVNVWATVRRAVAEGVLSRARGRQVEAVSEAQFYQERTWASIAGALDWPSALLDRWVHFVFRRPVDLKADDARTCLKALARAPRNRGPVRSARFSSFVRRSRIKVGQGATPEVEAAGTRTLLLAELARLARLEPDAARARAFFEALPEDGWADDERMLAAEAMALEELVLSAPEAFVSDGPTRLEGARLELQRRRARVKRRGR